MIQSQVVEPFIILSSQDLAADLGISHATVCCLQFSMQKTTQKQHFSLVVEPYPLEKYEFVRLDHHPNYWGKYVLVMLSHVPNHQPEHVVAPADLSGRPRDPQLLPQVFVGLGGQIDSAMIAEILQKKMLPTGNNRAYCRNDDYCREKGKGVDSHLHGALS